MNSNQIYNATESNKLLPGPFLQPNQGKGHLTVLEYEEKESVQQKKRLV